MFATIAAMSPGWQAALYAIAIVMFIAAAFNARVNINLVAAGLAVVTFVAFWAALARA